MKKSRAGKALAVGVFALAASNKQDKTDITVCLKNGNVALYVIVGKSGAMVRAKIQPYMAAHGVPCLDDAVVTASAAPLSAADEDTSWPLSETQEPSRTKSLSPIRLLCCLG